MTIGIKKFMEIATSEQIGLLSDLADLAEKEKDLADKITEIYSSANKWPRIYSDGEGITLCEDEDDANVVSLRYKVELKEVRTKMATLFKKAVNELDMKDVGIIQRQYSNYVKEE